MTREATIITDEPIVEVVAEMKLDHAGVLNMASWVKRYRPECVPPSGFEYVTDLLPHDGRDVDEARRQSMGLPTLMRDVTDNELLCELAGRKCYDSFAEKGAKRTNGEYLASMWTGRGVPHRSTGYHAKMSFFFAHISRRVSHELIRNYVGADRDEEGSPSQESTRFTEHPGVYIAHPYDILGLVGTARPAARDGGQGHVEGRPALALPSTLLVEFTKLAQDNYQSYLSFIKRRIESFRTLYGAEAEPKGMDRKRIYEAASGRLLQSCATSFIWTTNPMALMKFFGERCDEAADLEMQRFANKLKRVCLERWPNLFPGVK